MPTPQTVLQLLASGRSYRDMARADMARAVGVCPGRLRLGATGTPAGAGSNRPPGNATGSAPPLGRLTAGDGHQPADTAAAFLRRRVERDVAMRQAAGRRQAAAWLGASGPKLAAGPGGAVAAADQPGVEEAAGDTPLDLTAAVGRQHATTVALLGVLQSPQPAHRDPDQLRRQQADMLIRHLARHEAAEQQVLWPAVADGVPGGVDLAAEATAQERDARRTLASLRQAKETAAFEDLVDLLHEELRRHHAHEDLVLRHLCLAVEPQILGQLGAEFVQRYRKVPSRPHPNLPSGPAVQRLVGAPIAVLDRWRDAFGPTGPSGHPR